MLKRRTIIAWAVVVLVPLGFAFLPPVLGRIGVTITASAPFSKAIVAALDQSPRGLTIVTDDLCPLMTEDLLAEAVAELWPIGASSITLDSNVAKGRGLPEGTLSASVSKPNGFLEGVQTLWLLVNDDGKFCRAHIQTYSW